jgi:hypothetical protein
MSKLEAVKTPNLCCMINSYRSCRRCSWVICKECLEKIHEYDRPHLVCYCTKCNKQLHWDDANTDLIDARGYSAYICNLCLHSSRVSAEDFLKGSI